MINNHTYTIGLMVPDISDPFFSRIAVGVEEVMYNKGYQVFYGNTSRNPSKEEKFIKNVIGRKMDGVLLTPNILNQRFLKLLDGLKVPGVFLRRRTPNGVDIPFVDVDHYKGAREAIEHLIFKGHTNIGFIGLSEYSFASNERLRGYKDTMRNYGLRIYDQRIKIAGRNFEDGKKAIREIYTADSSVTAIFTSSDVIGIGALEWLNQNNIKVPEEMAIIGFDNLDLSELYWTQLTTMSQSRKRMGMLAAELLFNMINGKGSKKSILLEAKLKERKTC